MKVGRRARYSLQACVSTMGLLVSQSAVERVWYRGHSSREPAVRAGAKCCASPTSWDKGRGMQVESLGLEVCMSWEWAGGGKYGGWVNSGGWP